MKIIQKQDVGWSPLQVSTAVKIEVLTLAHRMYTTSRAHRYQRRNEETISELLILWETGLYNLTSLQATTGITRKSIRTWLTGRVDFSQPQVRGQIKPEHLRFIIDRLTQELSTGDQGREKFIQRLIAEGSTPYLVRAIFGEETTRNDDHPVRTPIRPDDQGHPQKRQGVSAAQHQDQAPDRSGEGQEQPEPVDPGPVQGSAPRDQPAESGPAEDEGGESEYARVVAAKGGINGHSRPEDEGKQWNPLEDYEPDLDGDSFLRDHADTDASGLVPGFPALGEDFEFMAPPES